MTSPRPFTIRLRWIGHALVLGMIACSSPDVALRSYSAAIQEAQNAAWDALRAGGSTSIVIAIGDAHGVIWTQGFGVADLHFPGFSAEAARWLIKERDLRGIAIDTPSIDRGQSKDFQVHQVICGGDRLALENIAGCDRLPATGATLFVMPMKIGKGTGAPARVFARLPKGETR